jgi:tetratricopeptide (TPR) repeat protein
MKAEYRHQLQTNALADRMGRLVQGMKSGPPASRAALWVLGGLAIGVIVLWYVVSGLSANRSQVWVDFDSASVTDSVPRALASLQQIAAQNPGTIPARTAEFQRARILLGDGLRSLYTASRSRAIQNLEESRRLYEDLMQYSGNEPLLVQEALLGLARAEESLVGVPKEGETDESRGSLEQALRWYRQLADTYPDSYLGQQAAKHVEDLQDQEQVQKFYTDLNRFESGPKTLPKFGDDSKK